MVQATGCNGAVNPSLRRPHRHPRGCSRSSESSLPTIGIFTLNKQQWAGAKIIKIPSLTMKEKRTHRSLWPSDEIQLIWGEASSMIKLLFYFPGGIPLSTLHHSPCHSWRGCGDGLQLECHCFPSLLATTNLDQTQDQTSTEFNWRKRFVFFKLR